jgi:hypothetical protein
LTVAVERFLRFHWSPPSRTAQQHPVRAVCHAPSKVLPGLHGSIGPLSAFATASSGPRRSLAPALKELTARRGNNRYGDASDAMSVYYADLTNAVTSVLPSLRKQGRIVGSATSNHPAAVAAVGLLVIDLVASLFLTRGSKEPSKIEPGPRKRTPSRAASSGPKKELLAQEMRQLEAASALIAP